MVRVESRIRVRLTVKASTAYTRTQKGGKWKPAFMLARWGPSGGWLDLHMSLPLLAVRVVKIIPSKGRRTKS